MKKVIDQPLSEQQPEPMEEEQVADQPSADQDAELLDQEQVANQTPEQENELTEGAGESTDLVANELENQKDSPMPENNEETESDQPEAGDVEAL
uniref:Uncharacterized protein n=1 Tax=Ditylenchus dipsaci TaxID=166011 RepID=A0A915EAF4_9BILA